MSAEKNEVVIYTLSPEQLATIDELFRSVQDAVAEMTDEEIDEAIAEAVTETRFIRINPDR